MASAFSTLVLFLVFNLLSVHALLNQILEDGYAVTTVIDGHKLKINPHAVHFRSGSSDLVVLDSAGSAFYTVSFPISQDSVIKRFSGDGVKGYSDGESGTARFNKPGSFAVDGRGNVYVADRINHVIRKISGSGVTTIAGGYTQKTGAADGPGQNATFSDDFELDFVAKTCALLVCDRGNQLVRQINLKAEDCSGGSSSGAIEGVSIWKVAVAVGLACLIGIVIGLALRPYIRIFRRGKRVHRFNETWKHCLISVGKQVRIHFCANRSVVADYYYLVGSLLRRLFWLCYSHLSHLYGTDYRVVPQVSSSESISLLDANSVSSGSEITEITKSSKYDDQLKDLMVFDGSLELCNQKLEQKGGEENGERGFNGISRIEDMIETNVLHFKEVAKDRILVDGSLLASSGLVKRR